MAELEGNSGVGYNRRGSNEFLPIHECPISAPLLWRAAEALLQIAAENSAAARWMRSAGEVEFFTTRDETKLQMTSLCGKSKPASQHFANECRSSCPN